MAGTILDDLLTHVPNEAARRNEYPSNSFYRRLERGISHHHPEPHQWKVAQVSKHNHYLVALRECKDKHENSEHCLFTMYVACPEICYDHIIIPLSQRQLKTFLKGFLGI